MGPRREQHPTLCSATFRAFAGRQRLKRPTSSKYQLNRASGPTPGCRTPGLIETSSRAATLAVTCLDQDLDAARPLLEQAVDRLRQAGEDSELTPALMRLARLDWSAGNSVASERLLGEAADSAAQQDDDEMNSWVAALRGLRRDVAR